MFRQVLVANRGEVALRVIRACQEQGIETVLLASEPDAGGLPARRADRVIVRGGPMVYLDVSAVLEAAKEAGADALHPGYGFLSENPRLAQRCRAEGIAFVGPPAEVLELFGDKERARRAAADLGIPVVPGGGGTLRDASEARESAARLGYPVLLKAVAGGGGRGMRRVERPEEVEEAFERASSEAAEAFGDRTLYMEKHLPNVRHVEIQFACDGRGRGIWFPERDCSIQRRHQKLVEESPSPAVDEALRRAMGEAALRLAVASGYVGVGTAEFLLDGDGRFHFIEVNARLQVEHPVTEAVTGIDLVELQLRLSAGGTLPWRQDEVERRGWAIEMRINAEDPQRGFLPVPGRVHAYLPPGGPGVRVDSAAFPGWSIPPLYDSLVAKLIVWAPDRPLALARARRALAEFVVQGIPTTIPFHLWLLGQPGFSEGRATTRFVEEHYPGAWPPPPGGGAAGGVVKMAPGAQATGVPAHVQAAVVAAMSAYLEQDAAGLGEPASTFLVHAIAPDGVGGDRRTTGSASPAASAWRLAGWQEHILAMRQAQAGRRGHARRPAGGRWMRP